MHVVRQTCCTAPSGLPGSALPLLCRSSLLLRGQFRHRSQPCRIGRGLLIEHLLGITGTITAASTLWTGSFPGISNSTVLIIYTTECTLFMTVECWHLSFSSGPHRL